MSYTDRKITQEEINAHHVQGATDYLIGNAQQNKAVFDDLPEFIAGKFNDLIDEIAGQHGDEIKVAVDEWLAEHPEATTTVQDNSLTTAKYVDGSVTEPKIAAGAVTPSRLDRAYSTTDDLASVNANLTNELNVLDARMDEFATLPEGSTTADAELIDIRVGADGKTYQTAGAAVRGQVADLKSTISENGINSPFNVRYAVELNKYLRKSDGTIVSNSGLVSKITDFVPCESGDEFGYYGLGSGSIASVVWYDIDKGFISAEQYNKEVMVSDPQTVTAPSSAKFARFSSYKYGSDGSTVVLKINRTVPTSFGIESDFKKLSDDSSLVQKQYNSVVNSNLTAIPYTAYVDKKLYSVDGTVVTASGAVSKITDYIPCLEGEVYKYCGFGSGTLASVCFYDINKEFLSTANYNSEPYFTSVTIPSGAYFARFASSKFGNDTSAVIFGLYKSFGKSFDTFQSFDGKKWLVLGDSWVASSTLGAGVRTFCEYVREKLKFDIVYNKGVGGTGYWKGHSSNIAYYQRVPNFAETDADIVTVFGSLNDMGVEDGVYGSQILGTYTDNTTATVCGCINATLDALETKYPNALINVITPCPWSNSHDNDYPNQYANAIKQICEYRSIPCLDLFHGSSLRPWDATFLSTFYVDGAHANTLGHKRFSGLVQKFIESVCYIDN